jgi:hypothetical protein
MVSEFDKQNPQSLFALRNRGTWHIFPKDGNVRSYCGNAVTSDIRSEKSKNDRIDLDPVNVEDEIEKTPGIGSWCTSCVNAVLKRKDSLKDFAEGNR